MMLRIRIVSAFLVLALAPPAIITTPAAGAYRAPASPAATIELIGINAQGRSVPKLGLLLRGMRDLQIKVWWTVPGRHMQTLKVIAPDGSLYQTLMATFDAGVNRRRVGAHGGDTLVETILPVAGTWITEYSMQGHWTIEVYMDNSSRPVATSSFRVLP
jgi:hypothetical protein